MRKAASISLLFISSILSIFSQKQDSLMTASGSWNNGVKKYHYIFPDGNYEYDFTYWHPDTTLHMRGHFINNDIYIIDSWDRAGIPLVVDGNGFHIDYYENGQKKNEGFVNNKLPDSLWIEYYPNSQKKNEGYYKRSINHPKKSGIWNYWYNNGQLESSGLYDCGVKKGIWTYYHRNGKKRAEIEGSEYLNRGKYLKAWDINGVESLKKGKGFYYEYATDNTLRLQIQISDSLKDTAHYFFSNGNSMQTIKFVNDRNRSFGSQKYLLINCWDSLGNQIASKGNGWQYVYYNNRKLKSKQLYSNGIEDSLYTEFYPNGVIKESSVRKEGIKYHKIIYYNNGNKYYEINLHKNFYKLNHPQYTKWWFNGNYKEKQISEGILKYYSNGQLKALGIYCEDTLSKDVMKLNLDYYLIVEVEGNSFIQSALFESSQWKKTWYANGTLKTEVNYDTNNAILVMNTFYPSGVIKSKGAIKFNSWPVVHISETLFKDNFFYGYLKTGVWKYYDLSGNIREEKNFDKETIKNRKL